MIVSPENQTAQLCVINQSVNSQLFAQLLSRSAGMTTPQQQGSNGSADGGSPSSSHSNSNEMNGGDAEGVWSADIDCAFHEALQIYPPCGRRKIILSEEGKMYGRNELIARYIKIRCGKTRTRKQVSSHIQVLARKQNRERQTKIKVQEPKTEEPQTSAFETPKKISEVFQTSAVTPEAKKLIGETSGLLSTAALKREETSPSFSTTVPTTAPIQWPYNIIPSVFNNNVYGVNNGINNDENSYINFANAALSAQQLFSQSPSLIATASTNPLSAAMDSLPSLGKLLPGLMSPFPSVFNATASTNLVNPTALLAERTIASSKLLLCGFTAYVEREIAPGQTERVDIVKIPQFAEDPLETIHFSEIKEKFPDDLEELFRTGPTDAFFLVKCWANVAFNIDEVDQSALFAVDSFYDSPHNFDISISSKVCSFGKQQVEKVEVYSASEPTNLQSPMYRYRLEKSPMCDYMVCFIKKLKTLEDVQEMNCVLENFTILQIVTDKQTNETLMVIAFNFEVSPEPESSCRVYKLIS
ncbi:TEA domain-containing protein [Aphelenchoides besseyi]|nr:TEA domain-containing protein [Aphelenchoides besseyi]